MAGLAKTLADELAPTGSPCTTCCPGRILTDRLRNLFAETARQAGADVDDLVQTEMAKDIPLGRVGEPADMGHLVAFLCSAPASYLTGLTVAVNGGLLRRISERVAAGCPAPSAGLVAAVSRAAARP